MSVSEVTWDRRSVDKHTMVSQDLTKPHRCSLDQNEDGKVCRKGPLETGVKEVANGTSTH